MSIFNEAPSKTQETFGTKKETAVTPAAPTIKPVA